MKNKEEIFKLLRESVEDEREAKIVEDLVNKITFTMPPIEVVGEGRVKLDGFVYYQHKNSGHYITHICLHRLIWNYFYGEIPDGLEIHHKDFNPANNDITNLKMLTPAEHHKLHNEARRKKATCQCHYCGKKFDVPYRLRNKKYCSKECLLKAQKMPRSREVKKCPICGKIFETCPSTKTQYCSKVCAGKARTNESLETRTCIVCGKIFQSLKSRKRVYCSRECVQKARSQNASETKICKFCGKKFISRKITNRKYCSKECAKKAYRKRIKNNK